MSEYDEVQPTCDLCGEPEWCGEDLCPVCSTLGWNGETGNHVECEKAKSAS